MVKAVVVLKPKTIKLEFVASLLNIKESGRKDWLAWNQDNVSKWSGMVTHGLVSLN